MQIYVHKDNQQLGPFTEAEIRAQLAAGTISLQDHVWWQGQATWLPLGQTQIVTPAAPDAPGATFVPAPIAAPFGTTPVAHGATSQLAIWSLVCGCVSLICNLLTAIPAIILGHMALTATKKDPTLQGRGMALAGMIVGYIISGLTIAYFILVFVVLASMGNQVKEVFKTITSQINAAQAANGSGNNSSSDDSSSTNSDSTTNAPDSSTNNATATPDSSTNAAPTKLDGQ